MSKSMFHCEHCNISMTGPDNYKQHMEGKKHLKKLKASAGISASPQPNPVKNIPAGQVRVKGYAGRFVKPADAGAQTNDGIKIQTVQPLQAGAANAGLLLQTSNSDPVMKAVTANLLGKLPLKNPLYEGKCDVCDIQYTSKSHEEQHLSGKKHKRKFTTKEAMKNQDGAIFYCEFCNLHVNSLEQMEQHKSGSSHNKKVENSKNTQESTELPHSAAKKKFVPSSGTESSEQTAKSQNGTSFYCGFCNLHVNSMEQLEQHRSGSSHKKKVENAKDLQQGKKLSESDEKLEFGPNSETESWKQSNLQIPPMPPAALLDLKPLTYDK